MIWPLNEVGIKTEIERKEFAISVEANMKKVNVTFYKFALSTGNYEWNI